MDESFINCNLDKLDTQRDLIQDSKGSQIIKIDDDRLTFVIHFNLLVNCELWPRK